MKFFKTNTKKFIVAILVIVTLSTLFSIAGNAYQMGGPLYYTNSSGTKLYRIYLWNEDPSNPTNTTPYKINADMELMNSTNTFAVVYSSVCKYSPITGEYEIDSEYDSVNYFLGDLNEFGMLDNRRAQDVYYWTSVSNICNSSNTSVTDAYQSNAPRVPGKVRAEANIVVGTKKATPANSVPSNYKAYYKYTVSGDQLPTQWFTASYISDNNTFFRTWY